MADERRWRLDPAQFPKRIDLDLTPECLSKLKHISARTGRSISDIASELICQSSAAIGDDVDA